MDDRFKVTSSKEETTAFDKHIQFEFEGTVYYADLHWDSYDGYDMNFVDKDGKHVDTPEWFWNWDETEPVEYILDCLTEDKKVGA